MIGPPQYPPWFNSLGFDEISFGYAEIKLYSPPELEAAQIGYSRSEEGKSFCDGEPGSWKPEWLVIAYDTGLGDPFFIDTSVPRLPVLTAMHGEGSWEPHMIAWSLEDFAVALRAIEEISKDRKYPVALEQNPLSPQERTRVLNLIGAAHGDDLNMDFWDALLQG